MLTVFDFFPSAKIFLGLKSNFGENVESQLLIKLQYTYSNILRGLQYYYGHKQKLTQVISSSKKIVEFCTDEFSSHIVKCFQIPWRSKLTGS